MKNVMNLFNLDGRVAVVTGGSGLYGKQIVLALAQAGAKVYTVSRNLHSNEEYAEELRNKGYKVYAGELDQSNEESVNSFLEKVKNGGEKVDILINNAVLRTMSGYYDKCENFAKSMEVNATGLFIISRAFGEHMASNGGGSIVNIGSYMGILGPDFTMYKDTDMEGSGGMVPDYFFHKGGIHNYTKFLAALYGPKGVRCNVLNLGGFYSGQDERFVENYNKRTFLNRMANESDIMGAVVYLASDASEYVTGAALTIDGGYSAK